MGGRRRHDGIYGVDFLRYSNPIYRQVGRPCILGLLWVSRSKKTRQVKEQVACASVFTDIEIGQGEPLVFAGLPVVDYSD